VIEVKIKSPGSPLAEVRFYNNGKLIKQEKIEGKKHVYAEKYILPLTGGRNNLTVIAVNQLRTESDPAALHASYVHGQGLTELFVLSIGINEYENPAYRLNYAVNDAKAFSETLQDGASRLYFGIHEYFIKDDKANKPAITAAFEEIIAAAGPEDVFVFYYAGHGVMSVTASDVEEFYMITCNITNLYGAPEQLIERGISASDLMEFSRRIEAEKQVFVIDACHSGGALQSFAQRGAAREKAMAQLARSTGTFFLTASQDAQYANEANRLKHGLFTYALLEALLGQADSGDNKITVNELKSYVEDRVPELSEEYQGVAQYPTSYSFGQDFPIVIVEVPRD